MKLLKIAFAAAMAITLMLSGCRVVDENDTLVSEGKTELFWGEWKMTRVSIVPEMPVPDFILGLFLSGSPTWKTSAGTAPGETQIRYDGRETWFNIPRFGLQDLSISVNPPKSAWSVSDGMLAFKGGGKISVSKVSLIPGREFEDVVANYTDSVQMDYSPGFDQLAATVNIQVTGGSYTMDGQTKPITPYTATITYTGVRNK